MILLCVLEHIINVYHHGLFSGNLDMKCKDIR